MQIRMTDCLAGHCVISFPQGTCASPAGQDLAFTGGGGGADSHMVEGSVRGITGDAGLLEIKRRVEEACITRPANLASRTQHLLVLRDVSCLQQYTDNSRILPLVNSRRIPESFIHTECIYAYSDLCLFPLFLAAKVGWCGGIAHTQPAIRFEQQ